MAIAETVLFYGVFVRTTALCFAADAYAYSKGGLLAIDMIRSRLRRGQLSFSLPSTAIARTPDEIWRKIQQVRVQCATLNSELMELRSLGEMEDREIWADNWGDLFQDEKGELLFWEEGGIDSLVACRRDRLEHLVHDFGLDLPVPRPSYAAGVYRRMDVLTPISLRLAATGSDLSSSPVLAVKGSGGWDEGHAVAQFSKSALVLPHDVDVRFKRFLMLFNLEVENPPAPTFHSPTSSVTVASETTKRGKLGREAWDKKEREKNKKLEESHKKVCCPQPFVEAHWHLWSFIV